LMIGESADPLLPRYSRCHREQLRPSIFAMHLTLWS